MISWRNVSKAIDYYKSVGYNYIDVPWVVSNEAINVTLPEGKSPITCQYGNLVGSAEQSFIELMIKNLINIGKYVTASPCFRDDKIDKWHEQSFFKVELIEIFYDINDTNMLNNCLINLKNNACDFFKSLTNIQINEIKNLSEIDICVNDIEIGSYGIRSYKNWSWIYGTGYADPRFSKATTLNE